MFYSSEVFFELLKNTEQYDLMLSVAKEYLNGDGTDSYFENDRSTSTDATGEPGTPWPTLSLQQECCQLDIHMDIYPYPLQKSILEKKHAADNLTKMRHIWCRFFIKDSCAIDALVVNGIQQLTCW